MIVRLAGGLGNQFFQFAYGEKIAKNYGIRVRYDVGLCAHGNGCGLDRFNVSYKKTVRMSSLMWRVIYKFFRRAQFIQDEKAVMEYEPLRPSVKFLVGYWQHLSYFEDIRIELQKMYVYKGEYSSEQKKVLSDIKKDNSVAVHVRRGDYLQNSELYEIADISYYMRAMEYFRSKSVDSVFYIFSDDIAWCKEHIKGDNVVFIGAEISNSPYVDFELMKTCKHFVIGNSTFSWWASWLSENEGKEMIAPAKWFKEQRLQNAVRTALLRDYVTM